jgi:hypothetical protein
MSPNELSLVFLSESFGSWIAGFAKSLGRENARWYCGLSALVPNDKGHRN